jgi:hypothetical protein
MAVPGLRVLGLVVLDLVLPGMRALGLVTLGLVVVMRAAMRMRVFPSTVAVALST